MKASEARKITNENQLTFEKVIESINDQAKQGRNTCYLDNVSEKAKENLFNNGYKISKHVDPVTAIEFLKIEW